jgi:hypothetical protein
VIKTYLGHKKVKAEVMSLGDYSTYQGWDIPTNQNPEDKGYLVEYLDGGKPNHPAHDGYISWFPKDQLDNGYTDITDGFDIGEAVRQARAGNKVSRKSWNESNMFAYIVPAAYYKAQTSVIMDMAYDNGLIPYAEYWALKTPDGTVNTWSPSCADSLANDWQVDCAYLPTLHKQPLLIEYDQLSNRLATLSNFLRLGNPDSINKQDWDLLLWQEKHMDDLLDILEARVNLME